MTVQTTTTHPVLACAEQVRDQLQLVSGVEPLFMTTADKAAALVQLSAAATQVTELLARVLATSDDLAEESGARDAAAYLGHHTRRDRADACRLHRQGVALGHHPLTTAAVRSGRASMAQAEAITTAVDLLPDELPQPLKVEAEEYLLGYVDSCTPRQLRVLGQKVLEVVAPDVADELLGRKLADDEREARRRTFFSYRRNGDGTTDIKARLSDLTATRLLTYLQSFMNPRRDHLDDDARGAGTNGAEQVHPDTHEPGRAPDDRRPHGERMGAALTSLLETLDASHLPVHGGNATTVVVTIGYEKLLSGLGYATTPDVNGGDHLVSAAEARRLACTARIVPAVLDGASQVLDLGRARRLATPAQRLALALVQRTCIAEGCHLPATWCEAHHGDDTWAAGAGRTDLAELELACSRHHHLLHDPDYRTERIHPPDDPSRRGRIRFHRRSSSPLD